MEQQYGLGIDAGGTYTDVALVEFGTGKLVGFMKALTTKPDPSGGIRGALSGIERELLSRVKLVSLATTFATNAIVEERGGEAGLILIGYDQRPSEIPRNTRVLMAKGGHTVSGEEKAPLDLGLIGESIDTFIDGLDAVAITAFFSVRNPEHEMLVAQIIREEYRLPLVLGHQLSMRLDAIKRAITAWWNARLIPLISNLIQTTTRVLSEKGIRATLMVVRGDGTLMSAQTALDRPVDTILSGPAASILGAKHLSGLEQALVVDMGGTTTDMAMLSNGRVAIDSGGAHVGRWKTNVEAATVRTIGLGGDSLISLNNGGKLSVGPQRVVPLCLAAEQAPEILILLQKIILIASKRLTISVNPCSFYMRVEGLQRRESFDLPGHFGSSPVSELIAFRDTKHHQSARELQRLEKKGLVFRSALTPTDICVAQGKFRLGNRKAAQHGLSVFARYTGIDEFSLCEAVEEEITQRLCLETVKYLWPDNHDALSRLMNGFFKEPPSKTQKGCLDVSFKLAAPVIGGGAPAAAWLPVAFRRLHTECVLPKAYEVSVAVGAVVGMVNKTFIARIRPNESGLFTLYTDTGRNTFNAIKEAIEEGRETLERLARDRMRRDKVIDPLLDFTVEEKKVTSSHGKEIHLETVLHMHAKGRPNVWEQE